MLNEWKRAAIGVLIVCGFVLNSDVVHAEGEQQQQTVQSDSQQQIPLDGKKEPTPEQMRQITQKVVGPMMDQMGPMMGNMMAQMMEGMAKTMAKPEMAEYFATFTRQYYDALITRGFSKEEALQIVTAAGLPGLGKK